MEIIGKQLDVAMQMIGEGVEKTYQGEGSSPFQVWELSKDAYKNLNCIGEDQWEEHFGWYRTGGCVFEGKATVEFTVNGEKMLGYNEGNHKSYEDYDDMEPDTDFKNFKDWFYESMGLGKDTNMAIFAESLARDNNMKSSEFFKKYQG